jgi:hypothetical protein
VRYYGWYSNKGWGQRAKARPPGAAETGLPAQPPTAREARKGWAALIRHVYESSPLICPRCGSTMRIIAFIERHQTERRMLPVGTAEVLTGSILTPGGAGKAGGRAEFLPQTDKTRHGRRPSSFALVSAASCCPQLTAGFGASGGPAVPRARNGGESSRSPFTPVAPEIRG